MYSYIIHTVIIIHCMGTTDTCKQLTQGGWWVSFFIDVIECDDNPCGRLSVDDCQFSPIGFQSKCYHRIYTHTTHSHTHNTHALDESMKGSLLHKSALSSGPPGP